MPDTLADTVQVLHRVYSRPGVAVGFEGETVVVSPLFFTTVMLRGARLLLVTPINRSAALFAMEGTEARNTNPTRCE